jgi:hypothetical protein
MEINIELVVCDDVCNIYINKGVITKAITQLIPSIHM